MNSIMIFLAVILVSAVVLFAVVSQGSRGRSRGRHRGGRGGQRGFAGGQPLITLTREQIATRWITIQNMASQGGGNGLRGALLEADKLLDHVMRSQGASGDTMADRLRAFQNRFSNRDNVWRAHRVRNALAHDVGFDLVPSQAREALADFERALKDLGGL